MARNGRALEARARPGRCAARRGAATGPRRPGCRPPGPEKTRPAVLGVPAAGRLDQADHEVGHRLGREDHLVAAGRRASTAPLGPGQPADQLAPRGARWRRRRSRRCPAPAQAERVPSALRATRWRAPVGWAWRQPEPGRACPGRWSPPGARRTRPAPGPAGSARPKAPRQAGEHRRTAPTGRSRPAGASKSTASAPARPTRGAASSAGGEPRGVGLGRRAPGRPRRRRPPRRATPGRRARRPTVGTKLTTVTRRSRRTPLVVVVLLAKRTSASLRVLDDDHAVVRRPPASAASTTSGAGGEPARRRSPARLRPGVEDVARRRTSADGQPWLTGATWPGWPLPQLKAPPSR